MPTLTEWLDDIEAKAKAASPGPYNAERYGHGGGRFWTEHDGKRKLVADLYHVADRELFASNAPSTVERLVRLCRALMDEHRAAETVAMDEYAEEHADNLPVWWRAQVDTDETIAAIEAELGGDNGQE